MNNSILDSMPSMEPGFNGIMQSLISSVRVRGTASTLTLTRKNAFEPQCPCQEVPDSDFEGVYLFNLQLRSL